jgi:hypothetical protein
MVTDTLARSRHKRQVGTVRNGRATIRLILMLPTPTGPMDVPQSVVRARTGGGSSEPASIRTLSIKPSYSAFVSEDTSEVTV